MRHSLPTSLFALALAVFTAAVPSAVAADSPVVAKDSRALPGVALFEGKRTLWLGDSITQNGLYVSYFEYFLQKQYPQAKFDITSAGLASETLSGLSESGHAGGKFGRPCLFERLDRALKAVKPQLVVACYGMNDGIYKPYDEVRMKAFTTGVEKLAEACRKAGAKLVLVTPPVFEGGDAYEEVLQKFSAWEVAHAPAGVLFTADLHTAMNTERAARVAKNPKFKFTGDNVHPGELGHLVMALSVMKELGIKTPDAPAEEVLASVKTDPLWPVVNGRRSARSDAWLNFIGYSREKKVAPGTGDINAAEAKAAARQKQADALRVK